MQAAFVPPNANGYSRFDVEFLQNVLDVFLHGARAAFENRSDLAVAFAGSDPFHDFELAPGKGSQLGNSASFGSRFRCLAVPGGHGEIAFSGTRAVRLYV
jgi:hypothetical protein